jgi:2'-5' RNA ligase
MQHDNAVVNASTPFVMKPGTYEYLLVANPDTEMGSRMMAEKQSFYDRYNEKTAIRTQPYITVANFLADEDMEDTIARWIQRICGQQQSFQVVLNNFSGFPSHAVFVRVQNPGPFQSLAKQLKVIDSYVRTNGFPPAKLISNPHLTLARRLPEDVYTKAMFDYSQKEFHGSFVVRELVLLKRKHQFDQCEKINVFRFLPDVLPPSFTTQLNIF